mmetsp:Transcript_28692/g.35003  ORF Transcript_28692/g.35003 Transcript_28692/m.35003 type:complete len:372 (+) Transcript_28692:153-1268(+)
MFRRNSPKQPKLYDYAASCSDESNIYELINQRIKSHPTEAMYENKSSGFTALHMLSYHKRPSADTIKSLIDAYPLALMTNSAGGTPLHHAVRNSSVDVVELLIESCPEAAHIKDRFGCTPLQLACRSPVMTSEKVKAILAISPETASIVSDRTIPLRYITQRYHHFIRRVLNEANEANIWNSDIFQLSTCFDREGLNLLEDYWKTACCLVKAMRYGTTSIPQPTWKMLHSCLTINNCPLELIILATRVHPEQVYDTCKQTGNNAFHMFAMNSTIGVEAGKHIMDQIILHEQYIWKAAGAKNMENRVPLCIALEAGKVWEGGIDKLARAAMYLLRVQDPATGLYPFMIASIGEESSTNTIFNLLKLCPDLIH